MKVVYKESGNAQVQVKLKTQLAQFQVLTIIDLCGLERENIKKL